MSMERQQVQPTVASIVCPTAGRERGRVMCVTAQQGEYLLLADGKRRGQKAPKRKKRKHVQYLGEFGHLAMEGLRAGQAVTDSELRRALAIFRDRGPGQAAPHEAALRGNEEQESQTRLRQPPEARQAGLVTNLRRV